MIKLCDWNKFDIDKNFCCGKLCLKYLHLNKYNVYFLSKCTLDVAKTNHFDFIRGSHHLHKLLNYPFLNWDGITKWEDNVIKRSNKLQHWCLKIYFRVHRRLSNSDHFPISQCYIQCHSNVRHPSYMHSVRLNCRCLVHLPPNWCR